MTERQGILMPYVEYMVSEILDQKGSENIVPLIASDVEIIYGIRNDVLECMRELCRENKYVGTNTLNHPALKKK